VQAIIAADGRASHAQVVRLIDLVKLNGVRRFALNIERKVEG
jgi:biopolymer transport protein ExbD